MKLSHILLVALMAIGLNAKDTASVKTMNPVEVKVKAMVAEAKKHIKSVSAEQLHKMIKNEEDFLLIDVREPAEVIAGKIDHLDFKAIPNGYLPFKAKGLKTNKKIVIYCKAGSRGAFGTKLLQDLGFKDVYNLEGGVKGWLKAGYSLENSLGSFKK